MVLDYYKLREQPFGVTPDSRHLFLSATHREALASLLYGVEAGRGFLALIGEPGLGKTTLLFHALHQLRDEARTVFLFQTISNPADLLWAILTDLGVHETQGSLIEMQLRLNALLAEQARLGKRVVVVIDEAQNLDDSVLELVRMLSNFETTREKLMQIILSGQPQLAAKIASPGLVQLRQRVSIVACLRPFSPEETALYISHKMRTAGYGLDVPVFTKDALTLIAHYSEGIPRNINNLCFHALSLGFALKRRMIDREVVSEVVADLDLESWQKRALPVVRPEQREVQDAPMFISAATAQSTPVGWFWKAAVGILVLVIVSAAFFAGRRRPNPTIAEQVKSVGNPVAAATPSSFGPDRTPPVGPAGSIRVMPGQTLFGICVERLGSCSPELLQKIRGLNPWLTNPDHIESGQSIRIPDAQKPSGAIQSIAEQPVKASLSERDMQ